MIKHIINIHTLQMRHEDLERLSTLPKSNSNSWGLHTVQVQSPWAYLSMLSTSLQPSFLQMGSFQPRKPVLMISLGVRKVRTGSKGPGWICMKGQSHRRLPLRDSVQSLTTSTPAVQPYRLKSFSAKCFSSCWKSVWAVRGSSSKPGGLGTTEIKPYLQSSRIG